MCEDGALILTGEENTDCFYADLASHNFQIESFLKGESTLRVRDCRIGNVAQDIWLTFSWDIDGIVGILDRFSSITSSFSYLSILLKKEGSLIDLYPILKKHLPLHLYRSKNYQYLKWTKSFKFTEGDGFDFHFALLPKQGCLQFPEFKRHGFEKFLYAFYEDFRKQFSNTLMNLDKANLSRNTIKKNVISDIRKMHVLPDDRIFILEILDITLQKMDRIENFYPCIIAFKFGDRDHSNQIEVSAFNASTADVSIHAALTISSPILSQSLFWSRYGLQDIVGERGNIIPTFSLRSCANFQSNLDGKCMDISRGLREILQRPESLRFIQFYADSPHLSSSSIHPVFGAISSCGILGEKVQQALHHRATEYLRVASENTMKLGRINIRLEVVCMDFMRTGYYRADDFICIESLKNLISRYPLIVPFDDRVQRKGKTFTELLKSIPQHITLTLNELFNQYEQKGGFLSVWKTYQYEVANEVFWRGKPNAGMDNTYAINLGIGGTFPNRSLTWERGFLALEDSTSCALNDMSLPPLFFWHLTESSKSRICRIFNFSDFIGQSNKITGTRAILILLQDVLHDPSRKAECDISLLADLRGRKMPTWGILVGSINVDCLCERIMKKHAYKTPYVFGRVLEMLEENNIDMKEVLTAGFRQLKLVYFPDMRTVDNNRNSRMHWSGKAVLKLNDDANPSISIEDTAKRMTLDVIWFLEDKQLVYKSKFVEYIRDGGFVFPWMCNLLEILTDWNLESNIFVSILGYLSCIALIQNGWFVHFQNLEGLHNSLILRFPNLIQRLQTSQVLSFFSLSKLKHSQLKRLHESIPIGLRELNFYRNLDMEHYPTFSDCENINSDEENEDISIVTSYIEEKIVKTNRKHMPGGLKARWSPTEMEIMDHIVSINFIDAKIAYTEYLRQTERSSIPDRSFLSFKLKLMRIKQKINKP